MSIAVGFSKDDSPFLNEVRRVIRTKRLSLSTERSYLHYIIDYIYFHNKRHPKTLGEAEVQAYPSHLMLERLSIALYRITFLPSPIHMLFLGCEQGQMPEVHYYFSPS